MKHVTMSIHFNRWQDCKFGTLVWLISDSVSSYLRFVLVEGEAENEGDGLCHGNSAEKSHRILASTWFCRPYSIFQSKNWAAARRIFRGNSQYVGLGTTGFHMFHRFPVCFFCANQTISIPHSSIPNPPGAVWFSFCLVVNSFQWLRQSIAFEGWQCLWSTSVDVLGGQTSRKMLAMSE